MTTIYLVRHGETDWNRQHRIQGSTDIPLNDTGRAQAEAAGRLLARRPATAVYASPLSRAFETAEIIASAVGLPAPAPAPALVERRYGAAEGLTGDEIDRRYPGEAEVPGRETRDAVALRVIPAIVAIAERHPGESIVIVSHGGVIRTVVNEIADGAVTGTIRNGSVHSLRHTDGALDLVLFDDPIEAESLDADAEDLVEQNAVERRERLARH
jgi:uncharacterized phosphatase